MKFSETGRYEDVLRIDVLRYHNTSLLLPVTLWLCSYLFTHEEQRSLCSTRCHRSGRWSGGLLATAARAGMRVAEEEDKKGLGLCLSFAQWVIKADIQAFSTYIFSSEDDSPADFTAQYLPNIVSVASKYRGRSGNRTRGLSFARQAWYHSTTAISAVTLLKLGGRKAGRKMCVIPMPVRTLCWGGHALSALLSHVICLPHRILCWGGRNSNIGQVAKWEGTRRVVGSRGLTGRTFHRLPLSLFISPTCFELVSSHGTIFLI